MLNLNDLYQIKSFNNKYWKYECSYFHLIECNFSSGLISLVYVLDLFSFLSIISKVFKNWIIIVFSVKMSFCK